MAQGIEGNAAHVASCGVAKTVGYPGVGGFVGGEGEEDGDNKVNQVV